MRVLNRRKLTGVAVLGLLILLGLGVRYGAGIPQEAWNPLWSLAYLLALGAAFIAVFYDPKNFPEKTWDFNPKRGILYFFLGWVIFPLLVGVDALLGSDLSLSRLAIGTLCLSVLLGVLGTFTENVGI